MIEVSLINLLKLLWCQLFGLIHLNLHATTFGLGSGQQVPIRSEQIDREPSVTGNELGFC